MPGPSGHARQALV